MVLAGGTSRRFGSDKLIQPTGGGPLLASAVRGLAPGVRLVLVGAEPASVKAWPAQLAQASWVREDPPGGGPAAAMIAGLRVALAEPVDAIVVLPGDAPRAGDAAYQLLDRLDGEVAAVIATDPSGRQQPLQLALRPAAALALIEAAGGTGGAGASARTLVAALDPPPLAHRLRAAEAFDIDTHDQLTAWRTRESDAVSRVLSALDAVRSSAAVSAAPLVVALDGPSGSGKSTLALALALRTPAVVVTGDDFYGAELASLTWPQRDRLSDAQLAAVVIDWRRLREEALDPLRAGRAARLRPYDWAVHDGRLGRARQLPPEPLVIVEGVYAARPELADLVDLTVYVGADPVVRQARRDGRHADPTWRALWDRAERFYFEQVRPPSSFDLQIQGSGPQLS